jgi:hypothetical protein
MREVLRLFASGSHNGLWGRIKAFVVNGAPTRDEGIRIAQQITKWQCVVDDALSTPPTTSEPPSEPLTELVEDFNGWWLLNRERSVNAAYARIDQFTKAARELLEKMQ